MPEEAPIPSERDRDRYGQVTSDPSALATAALQREIKHLSDRMDLKIEGVVTALTTRLDAIDRATMVFTDNLVRVPTEVQKAIASEHALTLEKFAGVEQQFVALRASMEKSERVTKIAVDAALEAQTKANAAQAENFLLSSSKTEANFTKQIDGQMGIIGDIKERLTVIEARAMGQAGQKTEQNTTSHLVIAIIGIALSIGMALFAILRGLVGR